ncbi:unnamed protein product, partial [marine sediment metagenome]
DWGKIFQKVAGQVMEVLISEGPSKIPVIFISTR